MADNPNDDTLDNPKVPQLEKLSDVISSAIETDTIIPKQETKNMEVHHHPDLHHNRKKFKEYFLEFLMIFLAVTMGFIAENIRESIVENHSEKQYMTSLVRDLELDTLELSKGNLFRIQKKQALDSILKILAEQNGTQVSWMAYSLSRKFYGSRNFYQNSGTLDQLKNSGGLRLIRNRAIVDSIEAYDQQVRRMKARDDFESEAFSYNNKISEKLFEAKSVIKIFGVPMIQI